MARVLKDKSQFKFINNNLITKIDNSPLLINSTHTYIISLRNKTSITPLKLLGKFKVTIIIIIQYHGG